MTTAIDMITRAMRLNGTLGVGETVSADEAADGLDALNTMLDSWSIERMFVYYIVEESLTLIAAQATYTMGSGGDLNTTRPTRIDDSCFIRYAGIDTPLQVINADAYALICSKTIESNIPAYLFPDMQNPLVRLNFYPTPSSAAAVAHVKSWKQLQQFAALTDVLALPPGYKRAIEYSLAEEFGVEFGEAALNDQAMKRLSFIAARARANIKRVNAPAPVMRSEAGYMNSRLRGGSIYTG